MSEGKNLFFRINLGHILTIMANILLFGVIWGTLVARVNELESLTQAQQKTLDIQRDRVQEVIVSALKDSKDTAVHLSTIEAKLDYLVRKVDGKNFNSASLAKKE